MLLIIDLDNGRLLDAYLQQLTGLAFRFRSDAAIELMFRQGGVYVDPPGTGLIFLIKSSGKFEENPPLVLCDTFAKTGTGATAKWTGYAPIYGAAIETRLFVDGNPANDVASFPAMSAVAFQINGAPKPTELPYVTTTISNSLYAGTESAPTLPPPNGQPPTYLPAITALTGGTLTDLDGQPTAGVTVPRLYLVVLNGLARYYQLKAKAGEVVDGINVVEPIDYDEDTNDKVFVRVYDDVEHVKATTPAWSSTIVATTGGGATALDGQTGVIDGSTIFTLGRLLFLNITGSGLQAWVLSAGTDAESEFVVHPVNYHVTTFPYVFKKIL